MAAVGQVAEAVMVGVVEQAGLGPGIVVVVNRMQSGEAGGCQGGQHGAVEDCGDGHCVAGLGGAGAVVFCGEGAGGAAVVSGEMWGWSWVGDGTNTEMIVARASSLA